MTIIRAAKSAERTYLLGARMGRTDLGKTKTGNNLHRYLIHARKCERVLILTGLWGRLQCLFGSVFVSVFKPVGTDTIYFRVGNFNVMRGS